MRLRLNVGLYVNNKKDFVIEAYPKQPTRGMLTGEIPSGILVTHTPTGKSVAVNVFREQHKNRDEAIALLTRAMDVSA